MYTIVPRYTFFTLYVRLVVVAWQPIVRQVNICPREGRQWSQGGAMDLDRQLLPSQLDGINWGPLDHASCGPQLPPSNWWKLLFAVLVTNSAEH